MKWIPKANKFDDVFHLNFNIFIEWGLGKRHISPNKTFLESFVRWVWLFFNVIRRGWPNSKCYGNYVGLKIISSKFFQKYNGRGGLSRQFGYFWIEVDNYASFERTMIAWVDFYSRCFYYYYYYFGSQVLPETNVDNCLGKIIAKQCKSWI